MHPEIVEDWIVDVTSKLSVKEHANDSSTILSIISLVSVHNMHLCIEGLPFYRVLSRGVEVELGWLEDVLTLVWVDDHKPGSRIEVSSNKVVFKLSTGLIIQKILIASGHNSPFSFVLLISLNELEVDGALLLAVLCNMGVVCLIPIITFLVVVEMRWLGFQLLCGGVTSFGMVFNILHFPLLLVFAKNWAAQDSLCFCLDRLIFGLLEHSYLKLTTFI